MAPIACQILIIGAGAGGLCMGAKLREAGKDDFLILERAQGVGGTWRFNTYPGAACDIASHLYSFSFAPNLGWSRAYARQPEILAYLEDFARDQALEPHLRLGVNVRGAKWDGDNAKWLVETDDGSYVADILVSAVGMFGDLHWPDIRGLDAFAGKVFHSARWDHGHDLSGRSVAVIGSGASALQLVPEIAPKTGRFYHFQRQPQWVGTKDDQPFTGEQLEEFRRDPASARRLRDVILDNVDGAITFSDPAALRAAEERGLKNLALVEDPVTRAKLTPRGAYGCHRPLISQNYYPTFNLPHVEVVIDPIREITADAIVTDDGVERAVDTIIFSTGFATTKYLAVIDVVGRDGLRLADAWAEGAQAYLGVTVAGFPNLFMIYGPNTNNGTILYMIEQQVAHILQQLDRMTSEGWRRFEVRHDAMLRYNERLQEDILKVDVWQGACHGYYRAPSGRIVTQWPHNMKDYAAWISDADADAFEGS